MNVRKIIFLGRSTHAVIFCHLVRFNDVERRDICMLYVCMTYVRVYVCTCACVRACVCMYLHI